MRTLLHTSFACLVIALALNVAFTHAQGLWVTTYPAVALGARLPMDLSSVPWLKLRIDSTPGKANDVTLLSSKEPRVTHIDGTGEWKITFITP